MIELEEAAYSYGGSQSGSELLADLSLRLNPGSFHFLTGPSGAGKSTFLKLCYLELQPTRGSLRIFGEDVRDLDRERTALLRRRIGVVHQDCKFLDHLSLEENIALPLHVAGRDVASEAQNLDDLLAWVGLSMRRHAKPPELSGGERQRAALARALITGPDVVLADEPTGNVDWDMSQRLLSLLVELNRMGRAILIATHDLNLIRAAKSQISARVLRIKDHKLLHAGTDL